MKLFFAFFIGLMVYWCNALIVPVHAQSVDLTLSPPVVEILLSPNHKVSQTFTLTTEGTSIPLVANLHLVKPKGDTGHVTIDPNPLIESTIPLVITSSPPLNQPLSSEGRLALTLTFEGASLDTPQDIYLALVMQGDSGEPSASTSLTSPGIASLILVTLTPVGTLPVSLEIEDFSPPLLHDSWTTLTLTPTLKNTAPIMVRPEGSFEVISPSGESLRSLPLYPNLILGHASRALTASSQDPSLAQQESDLQPLALAWSPHWSNLGPHRLRLTITTQGGTKLTEVEKVIWIAPIRLTTALLVTVGCLLLWRRKSNKPVVSD